MGRPGETWVGRERRGRAGRDVGRPGETWEVRERRGEAGIDVGRVCTSRRWCVEVNRLCVEFVGRVWK